MNPVKAQIWIAIPFSVIVKKGISGEKDKKEEMEMKSGLLLLVLGTLLCLVLYAGCQDGDDDDDSTTMAAFQLYLIDAPVDEAEAIYLTVSKISVHPVGSDDDDETGDDDDEEAEDPGYGGWLELDVDVATYNLLELQNNVGALLADQDLPAGDYNQIRLLLDCEGENAPSIVIEGITYELEVPSGCQAGFKLPGHFTVSEESETVLIMDFDARKSIKQTGNDKYILTPVVRIIQADEAGNISGSVSVEDVRAVVYSFETGTYSPGGADPFENAVNSSITRADGTFVIPALPAGLYDIVVEATGYVTDVYVAEVEVIAGEETVLDPIALTPEE